MAESESNPKGFTERFNKTRLRDFTIEEARGWIINQLQQIEYAINRIIIHQFKPADQYQFSRVMLNSAILDMGSKIKVLGCLKAVDKKTLENMRKLCSIRNGFAHVPITTHITVNIREGEDEKFDDDGITSEQIIEVMNAQGELISKNAYEYLVEFWTINNEVREQLSKLETKLGA